MIRRGFVLGVVQALFPISSLIGSLIYPHLFAEFTRTDKNYPWILAGVPFYIGSFAFLCGAVLLVTKFRQHHRQMHLPHDGSDQVEEDNPLLSIDV
jgi:MFS family permease